VLELVGEFDAVMDGVAELEGVFEIEGEMVGLHAVMLV
jgi:hypothetical protein